MSEPSEPVDLAPSETASATVGLNAQSEARRGVLSAIKHEMAGDFVCAYRIAARAGITR